MSTHNRRVVITGVGVVSAIGLNRIEFWDSLREGQPGIKPIEAVDRTRLRFQNGAEVRGFNAFDHFDKKQVEVQDRFSQFGVVAAREAVADAKLEWTEDLRTRSSIVTGSCVGGQASEEQVFIDIYGKGRNSAHPLTVPRVMANAPASHISMEFGVRGPVYTISTACSSSNHAIGHAFWLVRQGASEVAIAGGSEAPFAIGHLKAWEALRAVATDTCRPFTKDRRGMIIGEGGAMLILESLESALKRNAHIYAEILGFGMSSDASHLTMPSIQGAAGAMREALRDGDVEPGQIGYINAHGTGTMANDGMETAAIRDVFGSHADNLAISSTKSMHGHTLGAAGAIESVATVLALRHGILPPTANYTEPDPQCDLDVIPNKARQAQVEYALSNTFAFGGLNAVLVFRRWDGGGTPDEFR